MLSSNSAGGDGNVHIELHFSTFCGLHGSGAGRPLKALHENCNRAEVINSELSSIDSQAGLR